MKYKISVICFVYVGYFVGSADSRGFKRWMPSNNFDEPNNWDSGKLPCPADKVIFPKNSAPVYIQTNTTLTELVLPSDGELIFGDYVSISFPVNPLDDGNCPGVEVKFNHTKPDSWFDIRNWCVTSDAEGDCSVSQPLVLESERLPCQYETAIFPPGRSFLVGLESGADIYLKGLLLDGQSHTSGSFRRYLDSKDGESQFIRASDGNPTTINIRGDDCSDKSGCACGNDKAAILDKVCAAVTCPEVPCGKSFVPMGSCCAKCGALLELDYTNNFRISSLKNMLQRNYLTKSDEYNGVDYMVAKTTLDHIQVILIDDNQGETASRMGRAVWEDLNRDADGKRRYGVSHVELTVSGSLQPQGHKSEKAKGTLGSGSVVGIVITIIIILLIIIIIVLYVKLRRSNRRASDYLPKLPAMSSFKSSFRKFNRFSMSPEEKNVVEVAPSIGFVDTVTMSELSRGFDNPMYSEPGAVVLQPEQGDYINGAAEVHLSNGTDNGFTNPLYGEGPVEELVHNGQASPSVLTMNPMFTTEGIEEDSEI